MLTFAAYDSVRIGTIVYMKYAAIEVEPVVDELPSFSQ